MLESRSIQSSPLQKVSLNELSSLASVGGIQRFQGDNDVVDIVSVVSEQINVARVHYSPEESLRYFYCFQRELLRILRVAVRPLHYTRLPI